MKSRAAIVVLATGVLVAALVRSAFSDAPAPPATLYVYSGTLRSIDLQARTITVQGSPAASQTFIVPTDAEVVVKDKPRAELRDLMIGNSVEVKYTEDDGALVAHRVAILGLKTP